MTQFIQQWKKRIEPLNKAELEFVKMMIERRYETIDDKEFLGSSTRCSNASCNTRLSRCDGRKLSRCARCVREGKEK